jgi:hypothetical protein
MKDQMREEFIKFANHWRYDLTLDENDFYECAVTQRTWDIWSSAWQASRAAIVVELPDWFTVHGSDSAFYCDEVIEALEKAGVSNK